MRRVIGCCKRENKVRDVNAFVVVKVVPCVALALRMKAAKATTGASAAVIYARQGD
jgi:hypothetical protein